MNITPIKVGPVNVCKTRSIIFQPLNFQVLQSMPTQPPTVKKKQMFEVIQVNTSNVSPKSNSRWNKTLLQSKSCKRQTKESIPVITKISPLQQFIQSLERESLHEQKQIEKTVGMLSTLGSNRHDKVFEAMVISKSRLSVPKMRLGRKPMKIMTTPITNLVINEPKEKPFFPYKTADLLIERCATGKNDRKIRSILKQELESKRSRLPTQGNIRVANKRIRFSNNNVVDLNRKFLGKKMSERSVQIKIPIPESIDT